MDSVDSCFTGGAFECKIINLSFTFNVIIITVCVGSCTCACHHIQYCDCTTNKFYALLVLAIISFATISSATCDAMDILDYYAYNLQL